MRVGMAAGGCPMAVSSLFYHYVVFSLISPQFAGQHLAYRTTAPPQSNNHKNISDLLDDLLRGYDNSVRPNFGGPPAVVEVDIMVRSMGPISEVDMTYSMDCYFRQSWVDRRLAFQGNKETLALSISMLERIWKPDTYFYNGKQSYLHTITTPNKFVRLYQDGRVLYSSREKERGTEMEGDALGCEPTATETHGDSEDSEGSSASNSCTNLSDHDRQLAALQELEDTIHKETYHVLPIMESRQGFTNLVANVQRISQAGRDAVDSCRCFLRASLEARAVADKAETSQHHLQTEILRLKNKLQDQARLTESARLDADSSRAREQSTLVLLEELRSELRKRTDPGECAMDDRRWRVREQAMTEELAYVKDLLRATYQEQDVIARRASFANLRAQQLSEELSTAQAALATDVRQKENLEQDLKQLRQDMEARGSEIDGLQALLEASRNRTDHQDNLLREAALREERQRKRAEQLQRLVDRGEQQLSGLQQALERRKQAEEEVRAQLQALDLELGRQRRQGTALEKARDLAASRLRYQNTRLNALATEKEALVADAAKLQRALEAAREEVTAAEHKARQSAARFVEVESRGARLTRVAEQQARALRTKQKLWDDLSHEYAAVRKKARQEETDKERLQHEKEHLTASLADKGLRLELAGEAHHLKELELAACKRELADCSAQQLQLGAQLDGVRGQLAAALRDLAEQRELSQAARSKIGIMDAAHEQLMEKAATKEKEALQLERLLARARTEGHVLRGETQRLETSVSGLRAELASATREGARLLTLMRRADAERARMRRESLARLDERDIIATVLTRRNDEVSLLREKLRLVSEGVVQAGRALQARDQDVQLLRLEVQRLRGEQRQLGLQVGSAPRLRAQLLRALQDLTQDRVRLRALEEELSSPLNVHRWRKLEGSDPTAYELLLKVQLLQKRILRLSAVAVRRENQLRHTEHLYMSLRRAVLPSDGMPDPHGVPRHTRLAARGRHLKALIAEVSALEALADRTTATRLLEPCWTRLCKRKAPAQEDEPQAKLPSPPPVT